MKTENYLYLGGAAVAAYVLYRIWKGSLGAPWTDETGQRALEQAGAKVTTKSSIPGDIKSYAVVGDTSFGFLPGDYNRLNWAQKALITLDKAIPGTWLSKMVLS